MCTRSCEGGRPGARREPLAALCLLYLLLPSTIALAAGTADQGYLADLIRRAADARLADDREWHLLLHYRRNLSGGSTSEADDPGFFLAPAGRTDPDAELAATLAQFFSDEPVGRSRQPAQCAFIARYHWLKEKLAFDEQRLPPPRCERFTAWLAELNPRAVTLIFPAAFMNNPASMFGHTLLRIDQKGQTEQTRLLAYTINFAADVPPDVGISFAWRGIFGWFKGYFSTVPYYLKVQEYRDIENRDIWEYRLTFTEAEIQRMLMHAWELGNAYFDYYFFKENCSYHLLSLLEVARPSLHLTDRFLFWTVPADTVRVVTQQPGLVDDIAYRPSRSTQIKRKRADLSKEERRLMDRMWQDPAVVGSEAFKHLPPERQASVLDLTSDYLRYRSVADSSRVALYREHNQALLAARSALRVKPPELRIAPFAEAPELGHKTSRVGLGNGWRNGEAFQELTLRAGYHDLLDPEKGYTPDAQIELLGVSIRHYDNRDQTRLERVTLANVLSLSPIGPLFKSPSWEFSAGMQTVRNLRVDQGCQLCSDEYMNGGIGAAVESHLLQREVYFAFAEAEANYSKAYAQDHRIGGGTVGLLATVTDRWRMLLSSSYLRFPLGEQSEAWRLSFGQRYTIYKDLVLRMEVHHREHDNDAVFAVQAYF